jgi:hypothetical protein
MTILEVAAYASIVSAICAVTMVYFTYFKGRGAPE